MPFTPFHIVFIWPILRKLRCDKIFLIAGSMIPDLEIPIMYVAGFQITRGIAHSIIGGFTIDPLIAILVGRLIYMSGNLKRVLGINDYPCSRWFNIWMISSSGALTHVSIDYLHHSYNPILWPIMLEYYEGPLAYLIGYGFATFTIHAISIILLVSILVYSSYRLGINFRKLLASPKILYRVLAEPGF
ncbi:MAG: DUF4184 family protein [Candidatus Caldarchaeales archaeon]